MPFLASSFQNRLHLKSNILDSNRLTYRIFGELFDRSLIARVKKYWPTQLVIS